VEEGERGLSPTVKATLFDRGLIRKEEAEASPLALTYIKAS